MEFLECCTFCCEWNCPWNKSYQPMAVIAFLLWKPAPDQEKTRRKWSHMHQAHEEWRRGCVENYEPIWSTFRFYFTFYPRDAMLARVIVIATCPSVCPSTRQYCVKTKKASGMISSPSGSPKTLVFWCQISSPYSKGFPPNGASNKGRSEKFSDFFSFKRLYL